MASCPDGQHCFEVDGQPVCLAAPPGDAAAPDDRIILFGVPVAVELMCDTAETPCRSPRDSGADRRPDPDGFHDRLGERAGDRDVYLARRATAEDMWETAAPAGAIDTTLVEEGSWMTGNGLALFFARDDQSVAGPPYDDLWVSERADWSRRSSTPPRRSRSGQHAATEASGGRRARPTEARWCSRARSRQRPDDHDLYLARDGGGQWDTVAHLPALSDGDERSLALVERQKTLFFSRASASSRPAGPATISRPPR
jgi:hypothetical protein